MSLLNKVAIVTGASSGIGAAIAIKLTEEGARVAIVGRNVEKLKSVSGICEQRGSKPLTIVADVSNDEDAKRVINDTINFYGKLDILVNNAGIANNVKLDDPNAMMVFDKVMTVNLRSVVNLTHLSMKHLIKTKGNIVNISSIAAKIAVSDSSFSYCTSKAAVDHFTRCAALALSVHGIRVNAINPGPVRTDLIVNAGIADKAIAGHVWDMVQKNTLLKRCGEAEEIADLVAFVASDKGRSITGSTIVTDNGGVLCGPSLRNLNYIIHAPT